jgi:DNA-binding MarR family transcriptional regulator
MTNGANAIARKKPGQGQAAGDARKGTPKPAENVVDLEMSTGTDSHMGLRLWLRMLTTTNLVQAELRRRLRAEFDTTLPRFDFMAQLERHPEGLKMSEISRRLMVTGGNVTGITDQLEKEGLVARDADPNDRRAFSVRLTPEGRALFDRMAVAHEQWVVEMFGGLGLDDKSKMHQRLGKLKQHLLDGFAWDRSKR